MTNKRYISLPLEGQSLLYFEEAYAASGLVSIGDYLRSLIRKDYEALCNRCSDIKDDE